MEQWYYHVTTQPRLNSIMHHGIQPGHKRRWKNKYGGKLGDTRYVYIVSDYKEAVRWASKVQWELGGGDRAKAPGIVILCLKNVPGEIEPDPSPEGQLSHQGTWYQVAATIPPQCIMKVVSLTIPLIRSLITADRQEQPLDHNIDVAE